MPVILNPEQIQDLVEGTLHKYGRRKWTDLTSDIQKFHFMPHILRKEKIKYAGGRGPSWNFMTEHSGAAHHTGLFAVDDVNIKDVMKKAKMDWRFTTTHWAYDEREPEINDGPDAIFELVKVREADAMISLAEKMEDTWWGPVPEPDDERTPHGLFYWNVPWATGEITPENGGFIGKNPVSGGGVTYSSGAAGLDSIIYPRWGNWAAKWTHATASDLVTKIRMALDHCNFEPPVPMPNYDRGAQRYSIYTNWQIHELLKKVLEHQNDALGGDLDPFGNPRMRRTPIEWVPALRDDIRDPVIGVDWSKIYPYFLSGEYLRRSGVKPSPNQHRVKRVFTDLTWETGCHDRRGQFMLTRLSATGTPT